LKLQWKKLVFSLVVPLAVGAYASFLTQDGMDTFAQLDKPPLAPPGWLFPVVWTLLYLMMGVGAYLVATSVKPEAAIRSAMNWYAAQLAFNFLWSIIFFNLDQYLIAFAWLVLLWLLILVTAVHFYRIRPIAGYLLIPYLVWVAFAGYLNLGIALLNEGAVINIL
jgi:tryptophan-rich sensory protein